MLNEVTFQYNYADIVRALRPFSSRPVTEEEWKNLNPRYISYYDSKNKWKQLKSNSSYPKLKKEKNDYSSDEIICVVDSGVDIAAKIYVYTGIRRGSDVIMDSIILKVFDSKSNAFSYPIEETKLLNDAKTHILERLQKNIAKLIEKIKKDIQPCPEEGCDGLIVEKYSPKTQSTFWACNRYPKCEYIDKERSKEANNGINPGPYDKICPKCGKKMLRRTAKKGKMAGREFWGCSAYPNCKYTENI